MKANVLITKDCVTLRLQDRLTFIDHARFGELLAVVVKERAPHLVIDCSELDYIDSSGLGMLLVAREQALNLQIAVTLFNPHGQVQQTLHHACFHELFTIR